MRINLITEGPIDVILLRPLLSAIAHNAGIHWPVQVEEDFVVNKIRKRGHGGVVEKLESIINDVSNGTYDKPDALVIALDYKKLAPVISRVKQMKSRFEWMVLAVPIQEIEAWWLADQGQTLRWLDLSFAAAREVGYGPDYSPEHDQNPKSTLSKVIDLSEKFDYTYGDGDTGITHDFVNEAWENYVDIDSLLAKCATGFGGFYQEVSPIFSTRSRRR